MGDRGLRDDGAAPGGGPVVFVSYSHKDAVWRDRFVVMLSPVVRERQLEVWSDQREVVGRAVASADR